MNLKDRVAIVTGAGKGIGKAIALTLARHGAIIIVNDIDIKMAAQVVDECAQFETACRALEADVAEESAVQRMADACLTEFGRIDILVNNAGILNTKPILDISVGEWDKIMSVNLRSVFVCSRAVFPAMMKQGGGRIINVASVAGKRGGGLLGSSAYAASKGGVIALTKGLAREGAPFNITCNAVTPALTETDLLNDFTGERRDKYLSSVPLGRFGTPQDTANAVCFLASDLASYITGEIMDVDGGVTMD